MSHITNNWQEANQRYLWVALAVVRSLLSHIAQCENQPHQCNRQDVTEALQEAAAAMPAPADLEQLCQIFSLSTFERHILLLCAGIELDACFAPLCAAAQGGKLLCGSETVDKRAVAVAVCTNWNWG